MARNATTFRRGQSGNPAGRKPLTDNQRLASQLRKDFQPQLVEFLKGVVLNEDVEMRDRIAAAKVLFVEEAPAAGAAAPALHVVSLIEQMSPAQLSALLESPHGKEPTAATSTVDAVATPASEGA